MWNQACDECILRWFFSFKVYLEKRMSWCSCRNRWWSNYYCKNTLLVMILLPIDYSLINYCENTLLVLLHLLQNWVCIELFSFYASECPNSPVYGSLVTWTITHSYHLCTIITFQVFQVVLSTTCWTSWVVTIGLIRTFISSSVCPTGVWVRGGDNCWSGFL